MDNRLEIILAAKDISGQAFASMQKQIASVTKSVFSLNGAIVSMAGGYGIGQIAGSFLQTARDFERFSTQLETITGSSEKAKTSMDWIADFTKNTPYELAQVTEAFVKLEAYGLNGTKWLTTLGDTASSMGKPLNMAVEAFADAVTGEFERLKEFGVKTSVEGDKVTFKWSQNGRDMVVSTTKTSSDISSALANIFSRFSGGMEKQSKTMDGLLSNLSDQFTMFQKTMMDAGIFEELKMQVGYVSKEFSGWAEANEEVIKQNIPMVITDIKLALEGFGTVLGYVGGIIENIRINFAAAGLVSGGQMPLIQFITSSTNELKEAVKQFDLSFQGVSGKINEKTPGYDIYAPKSSGPPSVSNTKNSSGATTQTKEHTAALSALKDEYAKLTMSAKDYEALKIHQWYEKEKEALKSVTPLLKETLALKLAANNQSFGFKAMQEATAKNYKDSMQAIYDEIDIEKQRDSYRVESATKSVEMNKQFQEEYKQATLSTFNFERDQLQIQYAAYDEYILNKDELNAWYAERVKKISDNETEAVQKLAKEETTELEKMFDGWAKGWSGTLNDMLWGAESTFKDIARSFAKMLTQMVIQKSIVDPFADIAGAGLKKAGNWFSGLVSGMGSTGLNGAWEVGPYATGGVLSGISAYRNQIVSSPTFVPNTRAYTAYATGGALFGENGNPEGIVPLKRMASGNLGVETSGNSAPNIQIQVINNTGSSASAKTTAPKWDGDKWVIGVIMDALQNNKGGFRTNMKGAMS